MKKTLYIIIIFISFITSSLTFAQDCAYYHEFECKYPSEGFDYSGQSRGAVFAYGMTSQFKIVTFGGEEYNISICHQFKVKNVRLRLMEDNESKTVIYDNSEFKYQKEVTFENNIARKIIIEVSVPTTPNDKEKNEMHCLGVLIHFKNKELQKHNKVGF